MAVFMSLAVPDPDLEIKGGGGGVGVWAVSKKIFPPFEPQFGLKIKGGTSPGSATNWCRITKVRDQWERIVWNTLSANEQIFPRISTQALKSWPNWQGVGGRGIGKHLFVFIGHLIEGSGGGGAHLVTLPLNRLLPFFWLNLHLKKQLQHNP